MLSLRTASALLAVTALASLGLAAVAAPAPAHAAAPDPVCVAADAAHTMSCTLTFGFTGAEQSFVVPPTVTSIEVELTGGAGGSASEPGGQAHRVTGRIPTTPGQTLYVLVGGNGSWGSGGFNGGGDPGVGTDATPGAAGGGGGATDIRTISSTTPLATIDSRLVVAGGGGGAGYSTHASGMSGGHVGTAGACASYPPTCGGSPGVGTTGGMPGTTGGSAGTLGAGGHGMDQLPGMTSYTALGGGGGGGLAGGGGGGGNGGGGGGSSLAGLGGGGQRTSSPPGAVIRYELDVDTVSFAGTEGDAGDTLSITAIASSSAAPGHTADATGKLSAIAVFAHQPVGTDPAELHCTGWDCTSAKSATYLMSPGFVATVPLPDIEPWFLPTGPFALTFASLPQAITFADGTLPLGGSTTLAATSDSGLPVSYALRSGDACTLVGAVLTSTDVGTCRVTASQAGENPYAAAPEATADFTTAAAVVAVPGDPAALTVVAGDAYVFPVTVEDGDGTPLAPQPALTFSAPGCGFDPVAGVFTVAGACTVSVGVPAAPSLGTSFVVEVLPAAPEALTLTAASDRVQQGSTLVFEVGGVDRFGNPVDTASATLSSSVAGDIVDGLRVTFPHASPHVITATLGEASTSITVEVIPTADEGALAATGAAEPWPRAGLLAALALLAGLLLVGRSRLPRRG